MFNFSSAEKKEVTLKEVFTVNTKSLAEKIAYIRDIDADRNGNIYLLDDKLFKVLVLNKQGKFIREFGGKGQGPGEFQIPINFLVKASGEVIVTDLKNRKFAVYKKDGKFIEDIKFSFRSSGGFMLANGNFLFKETKFPESQSESFKVALNLHNSKFEKIAKLIEIKTLNLFAEKIIGINYEMSMDVSRDSIVIGNPGNGYEIFIYDLNGKLLKTIKNDFKPIPPSKEYKTSYIENLGKYYKMLKSKLIFPDTLPPFHNLLTDEAARIFVFTYEPDKNASGYMVDVFNKEGKFISRALFKFPPFLRNAMRIRDNFLYYIYEDETGVQKIIIFKIIFDWHLKLKRDEIEKLKIRKINLRDLRFLRANRGINLKFNLKSKSSIKNFTGTCFPGGEKLFVDSDGQLNVCEKINQKAPKIGYVRNGFDFDSIRRIVRDYNEEIIKKKCWECDCWFLCDICLANSFRNNQFKIDCKVKKNYHRLLKKYLADLEEKEDENDKNNSNTYDNIADFMDGL